MRLNFAGLFVFIGLLFIAGFVLYLLPANSALSGKALSAFTFMLVIAGLFIFKRRSTNASMDKPFQEYLRELEQKGLLSKDEYKARRAFSCEEFEDEGSHYFVELEDGSVLYLAGQYLYYYEPIEVNQPRTFPCTEFTILRHKDEGRVLDPLCRGSVLEPELVAPPYTISDWRAGIIPLDGEVIHDRSYDQIKSDRLKLRK